MLSDILLVKPRLVLSFQQAKKQNRVFIQKKNKALPSQEKMMRLSLFLLCFICFGFHASSQTKIDGVYTEEVKIGEKKKELQVFYKYKTLKKDIKGVRVKFKNKTKSALTVDLVVGLYSNGVLLEKSTIADCLKKSFFDNITRPVHIIQSEVFEKEDITIEILDLVTTPVDECRETHSE